MEGLKVCTILDEGVRLKEYPNGPMDAAKKSGSKKMEREIGICRNTNDFTIGYAVHDVRISPLSLEDSVFPCHLKMRHNKRNTAFASCAHISSYTESVPNIPIAVITTTTAHTAVVRVQRDNLFTQKALLCSTKAQ